MLTGESALTVDKPFLFLRFPGSDTTTATLPHNMAEVEKKPVVADNNSLDEKPNKGSLTPVSLESQGTDGPTFDSEQTGALLRKLDWNIVPFLSLLYLFVSQRAPTEARRN